MAHVSFVHFLVWFYDVINAITNLQYDLSEKTTNFATEVRSTKD